MALSIYAVAVPPVLRMMTSLSAILEKAKADCTTRNIDPAVILNYRLAPDMFALTRQIQVVTDLAKGMAARLADIENPAFPDDETTIDALQARLAKAIDFIGSIPAARFDGAADRTIAMKLGPDVERSWSGIDYVTSFALPNVYFHATAAYAILRHAGLAIGKRDFLAGI